MSLYVDKIGLGINALERKLVVKIGKILA